MKYLLALTLALGCGAALAQSSPPPASGEHRGGEGRGGERPGFERFDINNDGFIDKKEAEKLPPRMAERLPTLDTNKDGRVSKDEFQAGMQRRGDGPPPQRPKE